jgi:hypothetical protein
MTVSVAPRLHLAAAFDGAVSMTHTEPFHSSTAIATLDWVSSAATRCG